MIYFTELGNLPAHDAKGEYLGHLVDLAINPSQNSFQVAYFFIMTPKKKLICIPHEQISSISVRAMQTGVPAGEIRDTAPHEGLIRIKKDVLDQQIIDVISQGDLVAKGTRVRIIDFSAHEAIVEVVREA